MLWGFLEQPICRKLTCCLARDADAGEGRGPGFFPSMECLETVVSCQVAGHLPLGPLCIVAGCVSEFL